MNTTQSIIVYRNPIEAAFWESGIAFPLIVGLILSVIVALALNSVFDRYNKWRGARRPNLSNLQTYAIVGGAIATMIATMMFLM